jgi:hypothetical protein
MRALTEAQMRLRALLNERRQAGRPAVVEEIDAVLCEDGRHVMAYCYLAGSVDPLAICFALDADEPFEPWRVERELMRPLTVVGGGSLKVLDPRQARPAGTLNVDETKKFIRAGKWHQNT